MLSECGKCHFRDPNFKNFPWATIPTDLPANGDPQHFWLRIKIPRSAPIIRTTRMKTKAYLNNERCNSCETARGCRDGKALMKMKHWSMKMSIIYELLAGSWRFDSFSDGHLERKNMNWCLLKLNVFNKDCCVRVLMASMINKSVSRCLLKTELDRRL